MDWKTIKQLCLYTMAIGVSIFALFFFITVTWIGYDVKQQCENAQLKHRGDCVSALIAVLNDETVPFQTRNSAIWALGQLGDARAALPLRSYYTGNIPPREPLNKGISQYELKKAIALAEGRTNITAMFWR